MTPHNRVPIQRRGSLWGNPILGSMGPNRGCSKLGCAFASSILVQPIIPGLSKYSSQRRSSGRRNSYAGKSWSNESARGRTNLNFTKWGKGIPKNGVSSVNMARNGPNRQPRSNRILGHENKSNITQVAHTAMFQLVKYPQIRPSVCTILLGFLLTLCGVIALLVPVIKERFTLALCIILVAIGTVLLFSGLFGIFYHGIRLRRHEIAIRKIVARQEGKNRNELSQIKFIREAQTGHIKKHNHVLCGHDTIQNNNVPIIEVSQFAENECVHKDGKNNAPAGRRIRRILPSFPVNQIHKNTPVDLRQQYFKGTKTDSNSNRIHDKNSYYSSEPNLLISCQSPTNNLCNYQANKLLIKQPIISPNAQDIFDIFHDPLILRAVTQFKYKCDCEFNTRTIHN